MEEESRERWLPYLEMDHECNLFGHMNSLVELFNGPKTRHPCDHDDSNLTTTTFLGNTINNSSSLEENTTGFDSIMPYTLSFEDSRAVPYYDLNKTICQYHHGGENSKENTTQLELNNNNNIRKSNKRGRSSSQIQDHIMSERRRRENLTKMFIALSAVIPGLKKTDKASVLQTATDYVKYLEQCVKDLEEAKTKKRKIETSSVCFKMNKSNASPKIEARVLGKDVLVRVLCEKQKDIVPKLLGKLEALNLSIVCNNVLPFGNSALNITCIAQMGHEFSMTLDDMVKILTEDLFQCYN